MLLNYDIGEDSWESLECKQIQPVHPIGNHSWVFIGRTDVEAETPNALVTWCEELTHLKRPWCWERLRAGGEGDDRGWDGWMASPTQWTWIWVNSESWWWTGSLACCSPWSHKESDRTEWLNWLTVYDRKESRQIKHSLNKIFLFFLQISYVPVLILSPTYEDGLKSLEEITGQH